MKKFKTIITFPIFIIAKSFCGAVYFTEGAQEVSAAEEYNSQNTRRLDVEGMCGLLMKIAIVREAMRKD